MEYYSRHEVDCNDVDVQGESQWQKSWEPTELLQSCFSYHCHLAVSGAMYFGRHRLSAEARSEFFVLFPTCFWDTAQRGARRARLVDGGLNMDAQGRLFWGVLVPIPRGIGAELYSRAIDLRDVAMRAGFEGDKALLAYICARQEIEWEAVLPSCLGIPDFPYVYYHWETGNAMTLRRISGIVLVKNGCPSSV